MTAFHPEIEILDTTLRDGAQSESISYSVKDKLDIVHALDRAGISVIEAGNPGAVPKDMELFRALAGANPRARTRKTSLPFQRRKTSP